MLEFSRVYSNKDNEFLSLLFDPDSQVLFTEKSYKYQRFAFQMKNYNKTMFRIAWNRQFECFGLIEATLGCPFYTSSVKWISSGPNIVHKISKDDLFRRITNSTTSLLKNVKHKLFFTAQRILKHSQINGFNIPSNYSNNDLDLSYTDKIINDFSDEEPEKVMPEPESKEVYRNYAVVKNAGNDFK